LGRAMDLVYSLARECQRLRGRFSRRFTSHAGRSHDGKHGRPAPPTRGPIQVGGSQPPPPPLSPVLPQPHRLPSPCKQPRSHDMIS
jgi:hypothetical protein